MFMTHAMEEKIQLLDEYIEKLDEAISKKSDELAKQLRHEIVAVYENEIDGIRSGLDAYSPHHVYLTTPVDNIGDATILRAKLYNYKLNLASGLHKLLRNNDNSVNVTQNVQQAMKNSISISLDQTVSDINSLPQESLSAEDKDTLCGKLASLSAEKSKESKWEKAQGVLKWIAEKGFEVGKIALPYVLQSVFNTPA